MGVPLLRDREAGRQAAVGEGGDGGGGLPFAGLYEETAAGGEPPRGLGGDPAEDVQAVRAAVESDQGLVVAGLRGEEGDLFGGAVGDVGGEDVDAAAQVGGEGVEEVAGVDPAA